MPPIEIRCGLPSHTCGAGLKPGSPRDDRTTFSTLAGPAQDTPKAESTPDQTDVSNRNDSQEVPRSALYKEESVKYSDSIGARNCG